jgi:hypothetical protein
MVAEVGAIVKVACSTAPELWMTGGSTKVSTVEDADDSTPIRGTPPRGCALAKSGATRTARASVTTSPTVQGRMVISFFDTDCP